MNETSSPTDKKATARRIRWGAKKHENKVKPKRASFVNSMVRPGGVYLRRLDLEGFQTVNTACLCYMLVVALSELL